MQQNHPAPKAARAPDGVPAKFWDPERGEIRVDAMLKAYRDLERQMSGRVRVPAADDPPETAARFREAVGVPETPDAYEFDIEAIGFDPDPEVNARLHEAGMNHAQAQLVYELAAEQLAPLLRQAASDFEAEREEAKLIREFGGPERWRDVARQMRQWGEKNMSKEAVDALSCTHQGCMAMYRMMHGGEAPIFAGQADEQPLTHADLRKKMEDPRYWRDRDPDLHAEVAAGFSKLYD